MEEEILKHCKQVILAYRRNVIVHRKKKLNTSVGIHKIEPLVPSLKTQHLPKLLLGLPLILLLEITSIAHKTRLQFRVMQLW